MRMLSSAEKKFVDTLVEGTRALIVNKEMTTRQKVSALQRAVSGHAQQAVLLRAQRNAQADVLRMKQFDRLISLREEAAGYLVATAKWLASQDRGELSLDQRPQMFAVPRWQPEHFAA